MPVLANRTRKEIRQSIGWNVHGNIFKIGTTSSEVDSASVLDTSLRGGNNSQNGKWCYLVSGTNSGEYRAVDDYVQSTGDMTVAPAYTNSVAGSVIYELWGARYRPDWVEEVINQIVIETYARAYDPVEVLIHTGGGVSLFTPTGITGIKDIYVRTRFESVEITSCDSAFDESLATGLTAEVDAQDNRRGGISNKISVAVGAGSGAKITDSLTSTDISGMTHLEFWIKSSITTAASDIAILLDDSVNCASAIETIVCPILTAGVWQHVRVALSNPQSDTAIISVGVQMTTDSGAQTVWVDDIRAVNQDSATWDLVHPHGWRTNPEAGTLSLTEISKINIGYALLKLKGGDKPALLSADATVSEISSTYIIAATTAQLFLGDGKEKERDYLFWESKAKTARKGLMRMRGMRKLA